MNPVGMKILNTEGLVGKVKYVSGRYCSVCGRNRCLVVKWSDGSITKPCMHSVSVENDVLKILKG